PPHARDEATSAGETGDLQTAGGSGHRGFDLLFGDLLGGVDRSGDGVEDDVAVFGLVKVGVDFDLRDLALAVDGRGHAVAGDLRGPLALLHLFVDRLDFALNARSLAHQLVHVRHRLDLFTR